LGRSKRSFDRLLKQYKYKDLAFRLTNVPVLSWIGRRIIDADSITLTYVPVNEDLELAPGTVAPISVIEHFINEASHHLLLKRARAGARTGATISTATSGALSSGRRSSTSTRRLGGS